MKFFKFNYSKGNKPFLGMAIIFFVLGIGPRFFWFFMGLFFLLSFLEEQDTIVTTVANKITPTPKIFTLIQAPPVI
ncbi:hypothetical protein [Enterococcus sp. DIV1059_2]|uniref:hypothetical protein n=1 Tax=Enterococcus sp. DIV1059_2 TaxID=2774664 RepID=UPI003F24BBA4